MSTGLNTVPSTQMIPSPGVHAPDPVPPVPPVPEVVPVLLVPPPLPHAAKTSTITASPILRIPCCIITLLGEKTVYDPLAHVHPKQKHGNQIRPLCPES